MRTIKTVEYGRRAIYSLWGRKLKNSKCESSAECVAIDAKPVLMAQGLVRRAEDLEVPGFSPTQN